MLARVTCYLLFLGTLLFALYSILDYIDRPFKFVSYSTNKCVAIEYVDKTRAPCSALSDTDKYIFRWVP